MFVFFFVKPQSTCDTTFLDFWQGHLWLFTDILLENDTGKGKDFMVDFSKIFTGELEKFTGILKNSCRGNFNACHGHFCPLTSKFWTSSLIKHKTHTVWQVHVSLQGIGIGLTEKVWTNILTLLKVGAKLLNFQRAASYFFEILSSWVQSWGFLYF